MTDGDPSRLFGLDDSNLGFMDDRSASCDLKSDPSGTSDDAQFDSSGWDFPNADPFNFDAITSGPSIQPTYDTASWDPSFFDAGQSPGFDSLSSPENNPMFLFGGSLIPPEEKPRQRSSTMQTARNNVTTLTPALQEKLRNIAMPPHLHYHSPNSASSPESLTAPNKASGSSDNEASSNKQKSKKRKISIDHDDDEDEDEDGKPVKKTSHNMIEKRYRNNLNDKIAALRDAVPSLRIMSKSARGEDTTEDRQELHGLTPAHKLNKATVLSKATEYIRHLEKRYSRLQEESNTMRARIAAFEKLFMAGAMNGNITPSQQPPPTPMQYSNKEIQPKDFSPVKTASDPSTSPPAGMIQVPDDMKRIIAAQMAVGQPYAVPQQSFRGSPQQTILQQQQIQQQQQMQQGRWANAGPYFGKLMVGSLAGLMVLEALQEDEVSNDKPEGRGLFALPVQLLGKFGSVLDYNFMGYHVHTSLKLLLLLGTLLWVFIPSLFASRRNPKKAQISTLQSAPSLASSTHVRQAWLTAVQNVWMPRHNFVIEAGSLILKAMNLSLCNVIGLGGYQLLSGMSQEQETARIQAWTIALDSQLAGGDVEINRSRLVLTLLASGTLPDTPARLMLKSLHIRLLLWNSKNTKQCGMGIVSAIASNLATSKWNEARQLNRMFKQASKTYSTLYDDALPEHLATLVEQECDDVLTPDVLQRAHNLAFHKETGNGIDARDSIDAMDSVVFDSALGSPLDAVAAWWSTLTLHQALTATLSKSESGLATRDENLQLAIKAAPVGSETRVRAIVARAALADQHRGSNIAAAIKVLGTDKMGVPNKDDTSIIESGSSSTDPNLQLTIRCATAIAHLKRSRAKASTDLRGLRFINDIAIPNVPSTMSLLAFAATLELAEQLYQHKTAAETFSNSLERLSGTLRIWIGGPSGDKCGVDAEVRHQVVDRCLSITKDLVGMEVDAGYCSQSEPDC